MESKSSYQAVETLEKGTTIVNLGIIKQILPHPSAGMVQIIFDPAREQRTKSYWYKKGDKLMVA